MNWIKINKKTDNLPADNCKCWLWSPDGLMFGEFNATVRGFYGWKKIDFSHYMIISEPTAPTNQEVKSLHHQTATGLPASTSLDGCPFHYCDKKPHCSGSCRYSK